MNTTAAAHEAVAPVLRKRLVATLRGVKQKKSKAVPSTTMTWRCPDSLKEYLEQTAYAEKRTQTEIIISGITLERELSRQLKDHLGRLEHYAAAGGWDLETDLARTLAALVVEGLAALDAKAVESRKAKK